MPNIFSGTDYRPTGDRVAIVVSTYNTSITDKLLTGSLQTLESRGFAQADIDVAKVPGAWEIPLAASVMAKSGKYAAVICLGCVIRGETTHDVHINTQVSQTLGNLAMQCQIPVAFGVLTCNTVEQAISRSGGAVGNKGVEAAEAALEMMGLLRNLPQSKP
ncbi:MULTISPECIES: 6,7-dimethyl-8-ribityllumazine synthase [Pirellulaceae]|uniref:6,7-dimethyl-8-ribityllumazine synthase n=1 Tax=Pirellulaceae TaxID=2691357 RepID=UPI002692D0D6|nr:MULTISPECIES: 6,7-dimethyl-8-ribityllumazine synthase [Pirellulaceae]